MPDAAEIAAINDAFADTKLSPADLLFVFGTRDTDSRRKKPRRLWREGFAAGPLSAAASPGADVSECEIKGAISRAGMPAEKILEDIAPRTPERMSSSRYR